MRQIQVNEDFSFYIFPFGSQRGMITKWSRPFSVDSVDRSKRYHFQFLLDISGSMSYTITGSTKSKLDVVKEALNESMEIFRRAIGEGLELGMTLITFNHTGNIVFHNELMTLENINELKQLVERIHCGGGTHTDLAFEKAIETRPDNTETICILLSDGYHNGGMSRDTLMMEYKGFCDKSIAIGKAEDYDIEFLSTISKEGIVNGGMMKEQVIDFIVDSLFGPISKVAKNVKMDFDGVSELKSNMSVNDRQIKFEEMMVYQTVFTILGDDIRDIVLRYDRLRDGEQKLNVIDLKNQGINDDLPSDRRMYDIISNIVDMNRTIEEIQRIESISERREFINEHLSKLRSIQETLSGEIPEEIESLMGVINGYLDGFISSLETLLLACREETQEEFSVQYTQLLFSSPGGRNVSASRSASAEYSGTPYRPVRGSARHGNIGQATVRQETVVEVPEETTSVDSTRLSVSNIGVLNPAETTPMPPGTPRRRNGYGGGVFY